MRNVAQYELVKPDELYLGKTYSEWLSDWVCWAFSEDPDEHNSGPVVFLKHYPRLKDLATESKGRYESIRKIPNVMIGENGIEIFEDQAVLVPIIMSYWASYEISDTETILRQKIRSDIDNGDNPPDINQATIDEVALVLNDEEMLKHRVETSLFTLMVPDAEPGTSYKDFVETPVMAGNLQAVASGYFCLVKNLKPRPEPYIVHSFARGATTEMGDYFAELLYEIKVLQSDYRTVSPRKGIIPERRIIQEIQKQEEKDRILRGGSISSDHYDRLIRIIENSRGVPRKGLRSKAKKNER